MVVPNLELSNLPELEPFFKLETAHSQTLMGHFVASPFLEAPFEQKFINLSVGESTSPDQCSLKIYKNKKPFVLSLFHGLSGDHTSDYIQRSAILAYKRGWTVVLVDHRGAGLAQGRARLPYHSGRGEDASDVLLQLKKDFPNQLQVAAGFSMSGSILLNLLTRRYGTEQPDYAVIVNAPIDLGQASMLLTKGFSRAYDIRFFQALKKEIQSRENIPLPKWGYTYNIDDLYTSLKSGFKDRNDYYEQCSVYPYVDRIQTPTFVLTAKDDPFIAFSRYQQAPWSEAVHLTYSKYGGHMGYYSKKKLENFGHRWLDLYLSRVLDRIEANSK